MVEHYVILMSEMVANFQLDASLLQAMTKKGGRGGVLRGAKTCTGTCEKDEQTHKTYTELPTSLKIEEGIETLNDITTESMKVKNIQDMKH